MRVGQLVKVYGFYHGVIKQVLMGAYKVAYVKEGKQIISVVPATECKER